MVSVGVGDGNMFAAFDEKRGHSTICEIAAQYSANFYSQWQMKLSDDIKKRHLLNCYLSFYCSSFVLCIPNSSHFHLSHIFQFSTTMYFLKTRYSLLVLKPSLNLNHSINWSVKCCGYFLLARTYVFLMTEMICVRYCQVLRSF